MTREEEVKIGQKSVTSFMDGPVCADGAKHRDPRPPGDHIDDNYIINLIQISAFYTYFGDKSIGVNVFRPSSTR